MNSNQNRNVMVNIAGNGLSSSFVVPEKIALYLAQSAADERKESLLDLIAEYELEKDSDERENIERTLLEILRNEPVLK